MALLKRNGTHTFLPVPGSRATMWPLMPGAPIFTLECVTQPVWPHVTAHKGTSLIPPGAPTQSSRCVSALTCDFHHPPPITLPSLGKLCSRLSSWLTVLFQFRSTQLSTWLPPGPLARAKTHPSGLLAPVALLTFPELHSALIIPLLTTVKEKYRQALQAGSSGLLPALGHTSVFALVAGHCKHSITLWFLHSKWAWWRAGLLWPPGA